MMFDRHTYLCMHCHLLHIAYCITAHLYEEQISTGVIAVAQECCEASWRAALNSRGAILP